jgi:F-type H+-transporting ATPase subunit delta
MALARGTARRYAEAAFQVAERDDAMETWTSALAIASERLAHEDAARFLSNPAIPTESRMIVLGRILGDDVSGPPRNLLALLLRRGRFDQLDAVVREFERMLRLREGIVEAHVVSAVELDEASMEALNGRLVAMTGGKIEMSTSIDPELLGGIQVRLGDRMIDGSVRGRLERLRTTFTTSAI